VLLIDEVAHERVVHVPLNALSASMRDTLGDPEEK
jgi:hypothetical protein